MDDFTSTQRQSRPDLSGLLSEQQYRDQAEFRAAIRRFLRFAEEQARVAGITPQQHSLLLLVRGHRSYPRVSIGDVAEGLQVRHHAASLLVDRGVRRGLLVRVEDQNDRRRALVSLTREGQRVLDEITIANQEELGKLDTLLFRESFLKALRSRGEQMDQPERSSVNSM